MPQRVRGVRRPRQVLNSKILLHHLVILSYPSLRVREVRKVLASLVPSLVDCPQAPVPVIGQNKFARLRDKL